MMTRFAQRLSILGVGMALVAITTQIPARAQDGNDVEVAPAAELVSWTEDFSQLVQELRRESSRNLHLHPRINAVGGVIWEDAEGPLVESWDCDEIVEAFLTRFESIDPFRLVILSESRMAITAPKAEQERIRGFAKRLRTMWQATTRIKITPLLFKATAWADARREFRNSPAIDPRRFWSYVRRFPAEIHIAASEERVARNGERVAIERLQSRAFVQSLSVQTAIESSAVDPITESLLTGYSIEWAPFVLRNGERVWLNFEGQGASLIGMQSYSAIGNDTTIELPHISVGEMAVSLLAEPGKLYLISPGRLASDDFAHAFAVEVAVDAPRVAELPGEMVIPGLASKRYDVFELCLPIENSSRRLLRIPGTNNPFDWLDDNAEYAGGVEYDDVPELIEELCPDLDVLSSRESFLSAVGGGYIEVVNTPAAHGAIQRALAAMRTARAQSLATDVVALRFTAEQAARIPDLSAHATAVNRSPERILSMVNRDDWISVTACDTTIFHAERQTVDAYLARERSYVSDFDVQVQQGTSIAEPIVDTFDAGFSLAICARQATDGESWETTVKGEWSTFDGNMGTTQYTASAGGVSGGTVHQPTIESERISFRGVSNGDKWAMTTCADPSDPTRTLYIFVRTRSLEK